MIVVDGVSKHYGSHCAVRDLSFRIDDGECIGFLGLNGAGKSTTLRILSCLLLPTSGRVRIRELDIEEDPHDIRKFIGYLPEKPPLYPEMRVGEFLVFAGRLRGMTPEQVERRVPEVLASCNLDHVSEAVVSTLSHGYQQRVGIAQAIIHSPALLILDEPIQGLDPVQIVEMRELIRNLRGEHTILLSTHILSEIEQTCDRILMMHQGTIAAEGTEVELAKRFGGLGLCEMEVRGSESQLRQALGTLAGDSFEVLSTSGGSSSGPLVRVRMSLTAEQREQAAHAVVKSGLGLRGMFEATSGLEDIFVRLSQGDEERMKN